jgi:hypothetical protein
MSASVLEKMRARLGAAAERLLASFTPRRGRKAPKASPDAPPDPVVDPFASLTDARAIRSLLVERARSLARTCVALYDTTPTGLAPEIVTFHAGRDFEPNGDARHAFLRPEALESLFALRALGLQGDGGDGGGGGSGGGGEGDWVEAAAWRIFTSMELHARLRGGGHATVVDVGVGPFSPLRNGGVPSAGQKNVKDRLDSFVLAETHKYLYLLLSPPPGAPAGPHAASAAAAAGDDMWEDIRALRGWVLNTEAHPLRVSAPPSTWPAATAPKRDAPGKGAAREAQPQ